MELPWTRGRAAAPDGESTIMASRFQLKSRLTSPAFLLAALGIRRQALGSSGLIGTSLRAHPLRGEFWTLSAWTDEAALREFVGHDPHHTTMARFRPRMKEGVFRFWTTSELAPAGLWDEGVKRITR
jgi:hypothetical protein